LVFSPQMCEKLESSLRTVDDAIDNINVIYAVSIMQVLTF